MKTILSTLAVLLSATTAIATPLELTGAIGPYAIEVELERAEDSLTGRYRYAGRDAWIALTGEAFGTDALQLEETVDGTVTGQFYLEKNDQSFEGYWANETTSSKVNLTAADGALAVIFPPASVPDVNVALTGQYSVGTHWVNDWFAPHYEIGFNGVEVNVVAVTPEIILVGFEFVVGPTYHFASFLGHAERVEDGVFVHNAILPGGDTFCRLTFRFTEPQLSIEDQGNGFACHFGARAHANFDLEKVSNTAEFGNDW